MKTETIRLLKEKSKADIFTPERYELVKSLMRYAEIRDLKLKAYLSIDPTDKAHWIADHMEKLVKLGKI